MMILAAISGEWLILAGAITAVLGAAVGAWIAARLTYGFQQKLLRQQLDFQKEQAELDSIQRAAIASELNQKIQLLRDTIHHKRMTPYPPKN